MHKGRIVATGLLVALTMTGCANMRSREWGSCAVAGGLIGATIGGVTGGVTVNNVADDPDNGERAGGIAGGAAAGALLGALLGHLVCDPEKAAPAPPPPLPPPPAPGPRRLETLQGPNFDFNKSTLRPTGKEKLDRVAKTIQESPDMRVTCEGHTDSVGSDAYNQRLSERRAHTVRDYLIEKGVSPGRLTAVGYGESKPVASNATEEGRAENRRVELIAR